MTTPRDEDLKPYQPQKTYQEEADDTWDRDSLGNSLTDSTSYEEEQNRQWGTGG